MKTATASSDLAGTIEDTHASIANVCARTSILLLQHGAESALVESVTHRLGLALGVDSIEIVLVSNGVTLTTVVQGRSKTTVRRNQDRGINMHVVTEVQRTMLLAEEKKLDLPGVLRRLDEIQPFRYNPWLVSFAVGLSCAAFARLNLLSHDAPMEWGTCALTFVAAAVAMHARQLIARLHFNPQLNFFLASFVATSVASLGILHGWSTNPKLTISSSVLLFVPGFPFINAVSDMVKGYINTGISRAVLAMLLLLASSVGIGLAMTAWNTGN